jgi:hypothetical protein
MFFYIKEWPDKTATLMARDGAVLWTFSSEEEAQNVCQEWHQMYKEDLDYDETHEKLLGLDPGDATCTVG